MSEHQILLTGNSPETALLWARVAGGQVVASGAAVGVSAYVQGAYIPGLPLTVILRGEPFACRSVTTPAKNKKQLLQSAPYLLEDDLAGTMDGMHVAIASDLNDATKKIIAVDAGVMNDWVEALAKEGLNPTCLTVDYLCLPVTPDQSIVLIDEDRLVYASAANGFAAERHFAEGIFPKLSKEDGSFTAYVTHGASISSAMNGAPIHQLTDEIDLLGLYAASVENGMGKNNNTPNLLQGNYAAGTDWRSLIKPWRTVGILAAACAVFFLVTSITQGIRLNKAAEAMKVMSLEEFKTAYPQARVTNLRAAARTRAGNDAGVGSQDFLMLVAMLTEAIEEHGNVELLQIRFAPTGQLSVDVQIESVEQLDALKELLQAKKISVEEGRTLTPNGDILSGKLFLRVAS